MKDFKFYKSIRVNNSIVCKSSSSLRKLYDKIPSTKGCLENIDKNECCGAWCCQIQTPQLLYCEFLQIWKKISQEVTDNELCELFRRCMLNAVDTSPSKGCVFFNNENKLCTIHEVRPYNCRIYGITPAEEFNKRYEELKKIYSSIPSAQIRPQCNLVSTLDLFEVTSEDTNRWWMALNAIEKSIGIEEENINDDIGGSYRSPHDHILLYNMPDNILSGLSGIRLYKNHLDRVMAVGDIVNNIKEYFTNVRKTSKSENNENDL